MHLNDEKWETNDTNSNGKLKKGRFFLEIKHHFKSYCNSTSIHGFQYFGKNRTSFEKIYWIVSFLFTLTLCGYCIILIYDKWKKSPVIVSLATRDTPIYQIPFPAVTICPTIKFSREKYDVKKIIMNMLENQNVTKDEKFFFDYVIPVVCPILNFEFYSDEEDPSGQNNTDYNDIGEFLLKASPFYQQEFEVEFMTEKLDFEESLTPILTEEGACFTFNMLGPKEIYKDEVYFSDSFGYNVYNSEWIPQEGYEEDADLNTFPRRALFSGTSNSLTIDFEHNESDVDYLCSGSEQGYKLVLHMPTRVPMVPQEYILVPFNKATTITIVPTMISTSEMLRNYSPAQRECYFPEERKLRFFKIYSKKNCKLECLTNYTLGYCGCVGAAMPREKTTPVCKAYQYPCLKRAEKKFNLLNLASRLKGDKRRRMSSKARTFIAMSSSKYINLNETFNFTDLNNVTDNLTTEYPEILTLGNYYSEAKKNTFNDKSHLKTRCHCLPGCNDITYTGQISSLNYPWQRKYMEIIESRFISNETGRTKLHIFFKSNEVETIERNELYGPTDFLSNFGGLLGLFTGFSILSFLEIIYFLTVRICGNLKLFKRWYGEPDD